MTTLDTNIRSVVHAAQPAERGASTASVNSGLDTIGRESIRFGLATVIGWVGAMKFTAYEAEAVSGLVQNSPLMSWAYEILSTRQLGVVLGLVEVSIAAMIVSGFRFKKVGALGAALAIGMFLTTLSFLFSTPGVTEATLGGFPALSVMPGQFLIKDIVLLGASVWLLVQSLKTGEDSRA